MHVVVLVQIDPVNAEGRLKLVCCIQRSRRSRFPGPSGLYLHLYSIICYLTLAGGHLADGGWMGGINHVFSPPVPNECKPDVMLDWK